MTPVRPVNALDRMTLTASRDPIFALQTNVLIIPGVSRCSSCWAGAQRASPNRQTQTHSIPTLTSIRRTRTSGSACSSTSTSRSTTALPHSTTRAQITLVSTVAVARSLMTSLMRHAGSHFAIARKVLPVKSAKLPRFWIHVQTSRVKTTGHASLATNQMLAVTQPLVLMMTQVTRAHAWMASLERIVSLEWRTHRALVHMCPTVKQVCVAASTQAIDKSSS